MATQDLQKSIIRLGPGRRNPRILMGDVEIEFTYPPTKASVKLTENASTQQTAGGHWRKQSDTMTRTVHVEWWEPSNYIPMKLEEMLRGGGNRNQLVTYKHHTEILSQLGDGVEAEAEPGNGILNGFIEGFDPQPRGRDASGTKMYYCVMDFREANEVTP